MMDFLQPLPDRRLPENIGKERLLQMIGEAYRMAGTPLGGDMFEMIDELERPEVGTQGYQVAGGGRVFE